MTNGVGRLARLREGRWPLGGPRDATCFVNDMDFDDGAALNGSFIVGYVSYTTSQTRPGFLSLLLF